MKEEELIKRLESVKPPAIELEGHRRRLKMALLATGYPQKQRRFGGLMKGAGETMLKGLKSPQPLWKPLVFGALALALVIGLTWATLSSDGHPQVVTASDTITINSEISTMAYGAYDGLEDYGKIELMFDGEAGVIIYHYNAGSRTLTVNMEARELTLAEINQLGRGAELSESDEQKAIDTARADIEVDELLAQGASISKVIEEYIPYFGMIDSEIIMDGAVGKIPKNGAIVLLEQGDKHWIAHIDLAEGTVKSLKKLTG